MTTELKTMAVSQLLEAYSYTTVPPRLIEQMIGLIESFEHEAAIDALAKAERIEAMRTTKELLEVMLENIDKLKTGLCSHANNLWDDNVISGDEYKHIMQYLDACLPPPKYRGGHFGHLDYSFPFGEKEPRIKWLKEQIEKLK